MSSDPQRLSVEEMNRLHDATGGMEPYLSALKKASEASEGPKKTLAASDPSECEYSPGWILHLATELAEDKPSTANEIATVILKHAPKLTEPESSEPASWPAVDGRVPRIQEVGPQGECADICAAVHGFVIITQPSYGNPRHYFWKDEGWVCGSFRSGDGPEGGHWPTRAAAVAFLSSLTGKREADLIRRAFEPSDQEKSFDEMTEGYVESNFGHLLEPRGDLPIFTAVRAALLELKRLKQPPTVITGDGKPLPPIVCLCGSTRFSEAWAKARYDLTLAGEIVLTIGCDTKSDEGLGITEAQKIALDELHKRKIDLADYVLVLNVGGYIGASTRSEIDYATRLGKPIKYLDPPAKPVVPTPPKPRQFLFENKENKMRGWALELEDGRIDAMNMPLMTRAEFNQCWREVEGEQNG